MDELRVAGLRALPVVARNDHYIFGVDLEKVADLVGLKYDATPKLDAHQLIARYHVVLDASMRYSVQLPADRLHDKLPHRDRSYLTLINHVVQIAADFLEIADGADLVGRLAASLPEENLEVAGLTIRSAQLKDALGAWLNQTGADDLQAVVSTYFGEQTLHQVLERAVWHSAQHARQLLMVLELLNVVPDRPLSQVDFQGLPMPENVWDG